jgi:2,4-dienoyl-CoA reductase-like NADH-dependent reductase (Old Yellow Enzyme family)
MVPAWVYYPRQMSCLHRTPANRRTLTQLRTSQSTLRLCCGKPEDLGTGFAAGEGLAAAVDIPIVADGRYQSPREAAAAIETGAYAVVVGAAITRPHLITENFAAAVRKQLA